MFFPLYKGVIHYSLPSLELSKTGTKKKKRSEDYDIILSGGSVACSYGIKEQSFNLSNLISKKTNLKVLETCNEAYNLNQELKSLFSIDLSNKTLILVSGFNDAFMIENLVLKEQKKKKFLKYLSFFGESLFVNKILQKLIKSPEKLFDKNSYLINIKKIIKLANFKKILFIHQAYLSEKKSKSTQESKIWTQQKKQLKIHSFIKNREYINLLLQQNKKLILIDVQSNFERSEKNLFSDLCHLTNKGNLELSNLISEALIKK